MENICTNDEIVAILGHELGHWKLSHTLKNFVISQFSILISFFIFGQLMYNKEMFASFGFTHSTPIIIGLVIVFQAVLAPMNVVTAFLMTMLSRRFEFQADTFSTQLGFGEHLKTGLVKLQRSNLGDMDPDPWYSMYHYSHPPVVERIRAINNTMKKE